MPAATSPESSPAVDDITDVAVTKRGRYLYLLKFLLIFLGLGALFRSTAASANASLWHPWLLPGLLLSHLSCGFLAGRFRSSLAIPGIRIGAAQSVKLNAFATFCQFFVPLSVGADLTRFAICRELDPARRAWRCAAGIIIDHCTGLVTAIVIVMALSYSVFPNALMTTPYSALAVAGIFLLSITGAWYFARRTTRSTLRVLSTLRRHRSRLVLGLGLSLAMQVILAAAVYVGNVGWDLQLAYREVLWVLACCSVMQLVPFNVAGITVGDAAGAGLYIALGLALPDALRLVALFYAYRVSVAVIGGAWQLVPGSRKILL